MTRTRTQSTQRRSSGGETLTLALVGDVMLGRGVDQVLPHPGPPRLRERYVRDARGYVDLAETANGPVPRPVDFTWPWGEALRRLDEEAPDIRVLNLETSVTCDGDFAPGKEIHYRMHPANVPALTAVRPDVCVLANNHVLDFGRPGLAETLDALARAGLRTAGAGRTAAQAYAPATVPTRTGARVLLFALGMPSSGIPAAWAATAQRAGVAFVPAPTPEAAAELTDRVRRMKRPGDLAVVSLHWGTNWGYDLPREHLAFAHALVDGGVDLVHGHSSHHPRTLETYRGKLVLHGCGDFIDDYEGITGHERYRDDLRLLYLADFSLETGDLSELRIAPFQARRLTLCAPPPEDRAWLHTLLSRRLARGFDAPEPPEPPEETPSGGGTLTLHPRV